MENCPQDSIFVSIPAFNEMFIDRTIEDLFAKADNPERVFVGVFNQKTNDKTFEDFSSFKNVRVINAHCDIPLGVCLARLNASMLYNDEDYFFQIDAHNFFIDGWDSILINDYVELKSLGIQKPILSQSVQWHTVDAYSSTEYQNNMKPEDAYPLTLNTNGDTTVDKNYKLENVINGKFVEHYLVMGPFMFTGGSFVNEVSYDFRITYIPDQESTAVRAWTRGYRIFCNGATVVSTLSKMKLEGSQVVFDENNFSDDFKMNLRESGENKYKSLKRHNYHVKSFYDLLRGDLLGWFGSPDRKSIDEYLEKSGLDFRSVKKFCPGEKENLPDFLNKSIY